MKSKSNAIKYIFILFVIFIIGFAIYKIGNSEENVEIVSNVVINNVEAPIANITTNLRIGISNFDNINPISTKNRDIINISTILYEPLLSLTEDYQIKMALAKECSKIDGKSYVVKLKDDIKWDDGTPITANDVKFTIEKMKEGKSVYSSNASNIQSVEVIDEKTIRINLAKEEPFFEYNLVFPIMPSKQLSEENDFFTSRIAPMSSGMYKVKSATGESMELVKNNNWYNPNNEKLLIDSITIKFYGTMGDVYNSFKIGNIDMICTSNVNISDYIGTIGFTSKDYKGRELDFLSLNCASTILAYKEVRQAINYAIDKNKIVSSVYGNEYYVSSFPIDYGNYLYTKESKSSYDKKKAEEVLKNAGWTYQYGKWTKQDGNYTRTLQISLMVESPNKNRVKVAKLIEEQLESIGIIVDRYEISSDSYNNYLKNKNYDMLITGIYNGYSPDLSYFLGDENVCNYKNDEIRQILNEIKDITDNNLLREKYNRLIEIYEDEVPCVCLYRNKGKVVYNVRMTGNFNPTNYTAYYNFARWYRQ